MESIAHTKAIYYPYMGHSLCHTISILGPYMAHITRFGKGNWIYFSLYQYTSALHFSIISSSLFLTFGGVYHIITSCFITFSAADIDEKALSITV